MEKIRIFERKCLRTGSNIYRSHSSNYKKYISNQKLYKESFVIRIDNFIISLIRNNILRCTSCEENNLIKAPYYVDEMFIYETFKSGFVPPEAFIILDKKGLIQNQFQVPIFYHNYRRATTKTIDQNSNTELRFSTSIPDRELCMWEIEKKTNSGG